MAAVGVHVELTVRLVTTEAALGYATDEVDVRV